MNNSFAEEYRAIVPELLRTIFVRNKKNCLFAALFKNSRCSKCEQRTANAGGSYRLRCCYAAQCTEQRLKRFAFGEYAFYSIHTDTFIDINENTLPRSRQSSYSNQGEYKLLK